MAFDELFRSFPPFIWRSGAAGAVQFPIAKAHISLQHDIATHSFWGKDGERQESTGRKSLVFAASIPFRNGIFPGTNEKWGILYPETYSAFIKATANRATGVLSHPVFGDIKCKVRSVETELDATRRDGVDVEVTWVETIEPGDTGATSIRSVESVSIGATSLDAELVAATKNKLTAAGLLKKPKTEPSTSLFKFVQSIGDQITLLETRVGGKIDKMYANAEIIERAVTYPAQASNAVLRLSKRLVKDGGDTRRRARNFVDDPNSTASAEACLNWPIRQQIAILRNGLIDLRQNILASGKPIIFYTVPKNTTVAGIVASTGAKVPDLVKLNPGIVSKAIVPTGSVVRYYDNADR